jgi:hypothetical protein
VLGRSDAPPIGCTDRVRGSQRDRALGELGRGQGGAACPCARRRSVELGCNLLVGAGGRDRKVTCALFRIDIQIGEAAVVWCAVFTNLAWLWWNVIGCAVGVGAALVIEALLPARKASVPQEAG